MSAGLVLRDELGRTLPGGATPNVEGLNQYSNPRTAVQRRIDLAVVRKVEERPFCVESFADKVTEALEDPEKHLDFLRIVLDRVWAAVSKHELRTDGLAPPQGSAAQWEELAERAGSQVIEVETVAVAEPEPCAVEGAD